MCCKAGIEPASPGIPQSCVLICICKACLFTMNTFERLLFILFCFVFCFVFVPMENKEIHGEANWTLKDDVVLNYFSLSSRSLQLDGFSALRDCTSKMSGLLFRPPVLGSYKTATALISCSLTAVISQNSTGFAAIVVDFPSVLLGTNMQKNTFFLLEDICHEDLVCKHVNFLQDLRNCEC